MALDSSIKPLEIEPVGWGEATSVAMEFDLARQFPTAQEANSTTAGFPPGVTIKGTAGAAAVGPEIRVNTTTAGFQHAPSVSGLEGGGYVVTWTDHVGNIQFQRYDSAGALVGAESQVAAPLPFRALESSSVDGLADGGFVVVWTDSGSGEQRIYRRQYDISGAPIDAGAQVNLYDNDRQFGSRPSKAAATSFRGDPSGRMAANPVSMPSFMTRPAVESAARRASTASRLAPSTIPISSL